MVLDLVWNGFDIALAAERQSEFENDHQEKDRTGEALSKRGNTRERERIPCTSKRQRHRSIRL